MFSGHTTGEKGRGFGRCHCAGEQLILQERSGPLCSDKLLHTLSCAEICVCRLVGAVVQPEDIVGFLLSHLEAPV